MKNNWLFPVVICNLLGYLVWVLKINNNLINGLLLILFIGLLVRVFVHKVITVRISNFVLPVWIILALASMFVLMDLFFDVSVRDVTFVNLLGVTDYYKHLYAMTSINNLGIHPFYPVSNFIYYFGYYFVPALVSGLQIADQTKIIFLYTSLTGVLGWLSISELIAEHVKSLKARLAAIVYLVFGQGFDIVPTLMANKQGTGKLIELWSFERFIGLRVDNIFTSYLWTPQHFFAALAACVVILSVYGNKKEWVWNFLLIAYVLSSSVFVGIFMMIALVGIVIINRREEIKKYLMMFVLSGLVLIPNLKSFAEKGSGVFEGYSLLNGIFNFGLGRYLNTLVHLIIEYGIVFVIIPIGACILLRNKKNKILWILLGIVPVILTWFIKSVGYNDFSTRGILVWQMLAGILVGVLLERLNIKFKITLLALILINVVVSAAGFAYEFQARKNDLGSRLGPEESIMIGEIKKRDLNNLMAIGREEWIFLIPSMTGRVIFTSNLYDSAQYMESRYGEIHGQYESLEKEIFVNEVFDMNEELVVGQAEKKWGMVDAYFKMSGDRNLIVDRRNKSTLILAKLNVERIQLSGDFSLINTAEIQELLKDKKIKLTKQYIEKVKINDLLFVVRCDKGCVGEFVWAGDLKNYTDSRQKNERAFLYEIEMI